MIYEKSTYRFQLDKTKPRKKFTCPSCGKQRCFTRYIDMKTGEYVGDDFGICDRATHCGYHKRPTSSDINKGTPLFLSSHEINKGLLLSTQDYDDCIDPSTVLKYMGGYENNKLFKYLSGVFGFDRTYAAFVKYRVGTIDLYGWRGASIFWQIDNEWNVRTGKVMDYDEKTGHRVKGEWSHVTWYHSIENCDFNLKQCLFGSHLLDGLPEDTEVNIVESEKTAIIATICSPKSLFLSTGGLQNLRSEVMNILGDRKVIAYPDKGAAFFKWNDKIKDNLGGMNITVNSYLENKKEVNEGDDMADYLIIKELSKKK